MTKKSDEKRASIEQRGALAEWRGFVNWLVGVTPREHQDAARRAVEALPPGDRLAAKAAVLALLPADTCLTVLALIGQPGPLDRHGE